MGTLSSSVRIIIETLASAIHKSHCNNENDKSIFLYPNIRTEIFAVDDRLVNLACSSELQRRYLFIQVKLNHW